MKYVRLVVAVEDGLLDQFDDYMTCVLETEEIPEEFRVIPEVTRNPIAGSYSSTPYDDRADALGIDWAEQDAPSVPSEAIGEIATMILDASTEEDVLDAIGLVDRLAAIVPSRFHAELCRALELCPVHHIDAAICADDDRKDCEAVR